MCSKSFSEKQILALLSHADLVCAVWICEPDFLIEVRMLKGPEDLTQLASESMIDAIPVADGADFARWRDLFAGKTIPRANTRRPPAIANREVQHEGKLN